MTDQHRSNSTAAVWVDVTTLIHWQRPAVGIVRVEQQLCLWLTETRTPSRFCRYDRWQRRFFEIAPEAVAAHLQRIAAYGKPAPAQPLIAPRPQGLEARLRQHALDALAYVPDRFQSAMLGWLIRNKPRLLGLARRLVDASRRVYAGLKAIVPVFIKQRIRQALHPQRTESVPAESGEVSFARGDVYISLGLDWDYKDMAHLYTLKQAQGFRCLLFCYDLIPIRLPHLCVADVSRQFAHYFVDLAWAADLILCISKASRHDLQSFLAELDVPCPSTDVIHLGGNILPADEPDAAINPALERLMEQPYILFVSTIERRKNHETVYRAFARLAEEGLALPDLVFVGMPGWGVADFMADLALDPRIQGKIHLLNHVNDSELALLYKKADFTVYPSLYEGWGLPVAESLAFGKFCLCSNSSSLPEVGGDWVEYLDPWDVPAWVERLRFFITHPEEIALRNARIADQYVAHPWSSTAERIYTHARSLIA